MSSVALFCYVEIPILLARFPQQCTQSIKDNFLIKEQLHLKKINKILQDLHESILIEQQQQFLKPSASGNLHNNNNNSILENFNSYQPPKLYNRVHVAPAVQSKKIELNDETPKYLSRDASPMNKDDYYLFPKPEKSSIRIRSKIGDSSPKKLLRENSK